MSLEAAVPSFSLVRYQAGGTVSYNMAGSSSFFSLNPTFFSVSPHASLKLSYFLPQLIYGDDPLTPLVLEPSLPANLCVFIENVGYGTASSFQIQSAQPRIVDNHKGLLAQFQVVSATVNNTSVLPQLTLTLGDIYGQSTMIVVWQVLSKLLSSVSSFSASFFHVVPSTGAPMLPLVVSVDIYFLLKLVSLANTDNNNNHTYDDDYYHSPLGFLTDEIPDSENMPDTLRSSVFGVNSSSVHVVYQNLSFDLIGSQGNIQNYKIIFPPISSSLDASFLQPTWCYTRLNFDSWTSSLLINATKTFDTYLYPPKMSGTLTCPAIIMANPTFRRAFCIYLMNALHRC
eukprot:Pompholyxophrys_punicea_v1_NODE_9_length_7618_cov_25.552288.p2 type:complete len:343 gc:universal NODE_9_length_7618_cov_25.552288:3711-2683(-)